MKGQMQSMGFGYDWDREVTTCTPTTTSGTSGCSAASHEAGGSSSAATPR